VNLAPQKVEFVSLAILTPDPLFQKATFWLKMLKVIANKPILQQNCSKNNWKAIPFYDILIIYGLFNLHL
jgi:hypothetical protein